MSLRVLLVAGETSGDLHAAALLRELRRLRPELHAAGIGGQKLRAAGMEILVDMASVQTMGLVETFGTLGRLASAYRRLGRFLEVERPNLVILVDYPEFNLLLARRAKRLGIPVFYFIGPQVWAWRPGRVRRIARCVDRLAVVFPFEEGLYGRNADGKPLAEFVGHPLLDVVRPTRAPEQTRRRYGLAPDRPVLALLPGSRHKEVRYVFPAALEAAEELAGDGWQAIVALAPALEREVLSPWLGSEAEIPVALDDSYNVLAAADAAVVASGTATLEAALLAKPMVIVYRMAAVTYMLGRLLVRVDAIGMPNIVLGRRAFPELVQHQMTPRAIADPAAADAALREVREKLGSPGAAARAARLALELLS